MLVDHDHAQPGAYDQDVERLSADLKQQVERAKERISERYSKLVERRSFSPKRGRDS